MHTIEMAQMRTMHNCRARLALAQGAPMNFGNNFRQPTIARKNGKDPAQETLRRGALGDDGWT
jgi:hypothetical protein